MPIILIVDDDAALRGSIAETLADAGHVPITAVDGEKALELLRRRKVDAVLLDLRMPGMDGLEVLAHIVKAPNAPPTAILTAVANATNTIEAMRLGAADHLTKPIGRADLLALVERMLAPLADRNPPEETRETTGGDLVGPSGAMRDVQKAIGMLADSDVTVLISGETGTGKEVVARALHRHGHRRAKPFVAVNCAAIPTELLESQLFGHVRGAFTGAISDRLGSFREAHGGTLFLDEIGDMDLAMQAKLLRVLQERVVTPVGGRPVAIDVRIIAASHRDLQAAVNRGLFREDLLYRLHVVPLMLPPLRDRLADIIPLAEHFLGEAAQPHKELSADAAAFLLSYSWPGNVRELQNAMQRVNALIRRSIISASDLSFLNTQQRRTDPIDWLSGDLPAAVSRLEAAMIQRALASSNGNRTEAARALGIHRQLLHTKIQRYGLEAS
jgi:two-component system NtrC family response regulator